MTDHRFKVGALVALNADGRPESQARRYIVEAQMPPVGTALQYRIKSEAEGFRRVVVEDHLSSIGGPAAVAPSPRATHRGEED